MRERKYLSGNPYFFSTEIIVQVSDINYGGHVGNERYLLFAQETRMRFLASIGCSEMKFGPFGLVLVEAGVEYLAELFHGEKIIVSLAIENITRSSFDCFYKVETERGGNMINSALIKTTMLCFDYTERKVRSIPEEIKPSLQG
jgi:acyl-CoA thioesterase FadM